MVGLLATGKYTFYAVAKLSPEELEAAVPTLRRVMRAAAYREELASAVEELLAQAANAQTVHIFSQPKGRGYSARDIEIVLQRAHTVAKRPYQGRAAFVSTIRREAGR